MSKESQSPLPKRPVRHAVLVAVHADGYIEAFADDVIDVRIERIPMGGTRETEILAEDCFEASLQPRYREKWRADKLRANAIAVPLKASTALAARGCADAINRLNQLAKDEERTTWTL